MQWVVWSVQQTKGMTFVRGKQARSAFRASSPPCFASIYFAIHTHLFYLRRYPLRPLGKRGLASRPYVAEVQKHCRYARAVINQGICIAQTARVRGRVNDPDGESSTPQRCEGMDLPAVHTARQLPALHAHRHTSMPHFRSTPVCVPYFCPRPYRRTCMEIQWSEAVRNSSSLVSQFTIQTSVADLSIAELAVGIPERPCSPPLCLSLLLPRHSLQPSSPRVLHCPVRPPPPSACFCKSDSLINAPSTPVSLACPPDAPTAP